VNAAPQAKRATGAPADAPEVKAIEVARMIPAAYVHGDLMHLTLPGDERLEEGKQDVKRWQNIGGRLGMHQWIECTNDAGSMWRLMRVERVHGSPGTGLRGLWLRDVVPPSFADKADEPISATGDWYIMWGGAHKKWMVISPGGVVYQTGLNSEMAAQTVCRREAGNPKPL